MAMFWEDYLSDEMMGTFAPLVVYWLYAGLYHILPPLESYRLHSRKEEESKNLVSMKSVIKGVLLQQAIQASVSVTLFKITSQTNEARVAAQDSFIRLVVKFAIGMIVMDTWQYFVHRYMHINKFLYRHIHSHHHKLIVPYAFGALYNHPLEGLLLDTVGGVLSYLFSGMTPRLCVFFFTFATIKTIDDHCGLWLPGNLFHIIFHNNSAYHDIHHQLHGMKYNFSQPFFVMWDRLLGTHMPYTLEKRVDGGLEARPTKD